MAADDAPLRIAEPFVDAMLRAAVDAAPREACGLLVGRRREVVRVVPAANSDPSPARYTIAPEDHFAALRAARRDGFEVIGAWHSHPHGGPEPSPTDSAEAAPDFFYLIVGLAPAPAIAVWQLVDGNFVALSLVRT